MSSEEEYKQACDNVLLSRAKDNTGKVCVSGEIINGEFKKYSSEYIKWNLRAMRARVTVHLSDEEREKWFSDNLPPENKFE